MALLYRTVELPNQRVETTGARAFTREACPEMMYPGFDFDACGQAPVSHADRSA
jgi:hypothetical protein